MTFLLRRALHRNMQNLSFSLNATIPIFLMMVFGGLMKKVGLLDDHTTAKLNQFVFKALLPVLLFMDLSKADFQTVSPYYSPLFFKVSDVLLLIIYSSCATIFSSLFKMHFSLSQFGTSEHCRFVKYLVQ